MNHLISLIFGPHKHSSCSFASSLTSCNWTCSSALLHHLLFHKAAWKEYYVDFFSLEVPASSASGWRAFCWRVTVHSRFWCTHNNEPSSCNRWLSIMWTTLIVITHQNLVGLFSSETYHPSLHNKKKLIIHVLTSKSCGFFFFLAKIKYVDYFLGSHVNYFRGW